MAEEVKRKDIANILLGLVLPALAFFLTMWISAINSDIKELKLLDGRVKVLEFYMPKIEDKLNYIIQRMEKRR